MRTVTIEEHVLNAERLCDPRSRQTEPLSSTGLFYQVNDLQTVGSRGKGTTH